MPRPLPSQKDFYYCLSPVFQRSNCPREQQVYTAGPGKPESPLHSSGCAGNPEVPEVHAEGSQGACGQEEERASGRVETVLMALIILQRREEKTNPAISCLCRQLFDSSPMFFCPYSSPGCCCSLSRSLSLLCFLCSSLLSLILPRPRLSNRANDAPHPTHQPLHSRGL